MSNYDHDAIRQAYPNVVYIDDSKGIFDENWNEVKVDEEMIKVARAELNSKYEIELLNNKNAKQELLDKLGITEEEIRLLLS